MLEVFYGSDTGRVRAAALAAARTRAPELITPEEYQPGQLADAISRASLFGEARVIVIDTPTDALATELANHLPDLAQSSDRFIVIEGTLLAPAKKRYQKHTSDLTEYTAPKAAPFNTFRLAEALARKDKKALWLDYQAARQAGVPVESIIGILWWQLKTLRLAALTQSAAEAGLKDFPYRKAKEALRAIPPTEATRLSRELLTIYHQGHAGQVDLPIALERWLLTL